MALALVICDQVIVEEGTHKKTLVGIFNEIRAAKLPATHRSMSVFVSLTGGKGTYTCRMVLTSPASEEKSLFELAADINIPSPLHVVEMHFELRNLKFTHHGRHCFEFYCNDELVFTRPFRVRSNGEG